MNVWNYLRNKVRDSFLAGISDALAQIEGQGDEGTLQAVADLRARLAPALPAPEPEHKSNGKRRVKA